MNIHDRYGTKHNIWESVQNWIGGRTPFWLYHLILFIWEAVGKLMGPTIGTDHRPTYHAW